MGGRGGGREVIYKKSSYSENYTTGVNYQAQILNSEQVMLESSIQLVS